MRDDRLSFCIPLAIPEEGGGGFRFLRNLDSFLDREGIPHTRRPLAGARVLLLNAWHVRWPVVFAAAWAEPNVTVVHRVDGAAADYGRDPAVDRVQSTVNRLADLTIFQSEYSRYATRSKFPVITGDGPVIHNPVDITVFTPEGPLTDLPEARGPRVCAVTWSTNPLKGAASIHRLAVALPDVQFVLCGRFGATPAGANIVKLGVLSADRLASVMRSCDVLVTFSENESCPNVVLEALASGLPVLHKASGATPEIVGDCGVAVTEETFADGLRTIMSLRPELSVRARRRAVEHFAPDDVFDHYLSAIRTAADRRPETGRARRIGRLIARLREGPATSAR